MVALMKTDMMKGGMKASTNEQRLLTIFDVLKQYQFNFCVRVRSMTCTQLFVLWGISNVVGSKTYSREIYFNDKILLFVFMVG